MGEDAEVGRERQRMRRRGEFAALVEDRERADPPGEAVERLADVPCAVFAHPVEHDDRVVDREADDREHGGDKEGINLNVEERASNREEANRDDHVMQERDERTEGEGEFEAERDVDEDAEKSESEGEEGGSHGMARTYGVRGPCPWKRRRSQPMPRRLRKGISSRMAAGLPLTSIAWAASAASWPPTIA